MNIQSVVTAAILALGIAAGAALATGGQRTAEPEAAAEAGETQLLPAEAQYRFFGV
ncbi:MAG: hypothetical protein JNM90_25955 [Burkholderiales bacterium]|nr:hypothetical protein [Burkholderiales bacterium]